MVGAVPLPVAVPFGLTLANLTAGRLLADVFRAGINADMGAAFRHCVAGTPLDTSNAVEFVAATEPTPELIQTTTIKFPALFVHFSAEDDEEEEPFTATISKVKQTWIVDYILGPLMPDSYERLSSAILLARQITSAICRAGGHAAYDVDPSGGGPAKVFVGAGYEDLRCGKMIGSGAAAFEGSEVRYFGGRWTIKLTVLVGTDGTDSAAVPLQGATIDVDLETTPMVQGDDAPPAVDDFLVFQAEIP